MNNPKTLASMDLMLEAANILPHEAVHSREQRIPRIPAPAGLSSAPAGVRAKPQVLARVMANLAH